MPTFRRGIYSDQSSTTLCYHVDVFDWQAALKDVRAVIADALASPPSEAEIAREIAEFEVAFQVPVETQDTLAGS